MPSENFGKILYELRTRNHVTQRQLAYFVGVSDKVISKWERGISLPKADMITNIAHFFSTTADRLLSGKINSLEIAESDGSYDNECDFESENTTPKIKPFIPECTDINGGYQCTWALQKTVAEKYNITGKCCSENRDALTDNYLFGENSLYHPVSREYRKDLIFMIDDGWDVPFGTPNYGESNKLFGSMIPDSEKFSGFGITPAERLKNIAEKVKMLGYGGVGFWICIQKANSDDADDTPQKSRSYWEERAKWSNEAGVKYWKVDWGRHAINCEYRQMMTEAVRKYAPDLLIEHCTPLHPFTSYQYLDEKTIYETTLKNLKISDYFRLYDALDPLYNCNILKRFHDAEICAIDNGVKNNCILNVESRPIIAAAIGGSYGIMQYTPESEACIKWQRFAPPFGIAEADYHYSKETLTDNYYFANDIRNWLKCNGKYIEEADCPAIMSRGCELPIVKGCGGILPYVIVSRNPRSGAYSVASIRRTVDPYFDMPFLVDITLKVDEDTTLIGIFGVMNTLTVKFPKTFDKHKIIAQNLFSDETVDITDKVTVKEKELVIDGKILRYYGRTDSMENDRFYGPALFIRFIK